MEVGHRGGAWRLLVGAAVPEDGLCNTALAVHKSVDYLCNKVDDLCTGGKMLGIVEASQIHDGTVTWKNSFHALCINRNVKLSTCHAVMGHKID